MSGSANRSGSVACSQITSTLYNPASITDDSTKRHDKSEHRTGKKYQNTDKYN